MATTNKTTRVWTQKMTGGQRSGLQHLTLSTGGTRAPESLCGTPVSGDDWKALVGPREQTSCPACRRIAETAIAPDEAELSLKLAHPPGRPDTANAVSKFRDEPRKPHVR